MPPLLPSLSGPRFLLLVLASITVLGTGPRSLTAAIYVKIPNVPGDVTVEGYDDGKWFESDSGSYGTERLITDSGKGGTADINIGIGELLPVGLSFYLNRATAPLLKASITGGAIGDAEIHLVEAGSGPDQDQLFTFGIIKLTNAFVKTWFTSGDADERPFFEITLLYNEIEVTNRIFNPSDPKSPAQFTTYWNLVKNTGTYNEGGTAPNQKPTISKISAVSLSEDGSTTIPFTVQDPDGAAANLTVATSSSNNSLLPNSRISTSGSGSSRSLRLTPAPDRHGTATVTVSVSDSASSVSTSFLVTVTPSPDPPTIATIDPQIVDTDAPITLPVTPADPDQPADSLLLSATSNNQPLLPDANVTFTHDPTTGWLMTITPATGQSGSADITVTVTDNTGRSSSTSFLFTVNSAGNSAPTDILLVPNTIPENSPEGTIIGDLSAVDPESDPVITFALIGDAGGRFRLINGGQIATAETATFDYETRSTHIIHVRATDSQGAVFAKSVTIAVTNVNEPPEISLDLPPSIPPATPPGIPIPYPNIAFSDPDSASNPVTLTLDVIHGTLNIADSGVLSGQVTGNGTRILTVNAPVADIIQVISARGLTYTSNPGYEGADSLSATIADNGHSGDGDPQSASTSEPFFVKPEPLLGWRDTTFTPDELDDPAISGLLLDIDRDDLSAILEYKLAKNPKDPGDSWDNIQVREVQQEGETFIQLAFIQRTDESDPNTKLVVELADGSSPWSSSPAVVRIVQRIPLGDGLERVVIQPVFPRSAVDSLFMRFKVEYTGFSEIP